MIANSEARDRETGRERAEEDGQISQIAEMELEDPRAKQRLHVAGAASSVTGTTPG